MNELQLWIVPVCSVVTLLGTWVIQRVGESRRSGAMEERMESHRSWLKGLEAKSDDHEQRISRMEGALDAAPAHRR